MPLEMITEFCISSELVNIKLPSIDVYITRISPYNILPRDHKGMVSEGK